MRKVNYNNGNEKRYLEDCRYAVKKLVEAGIKPTLSVIVGYPVQGINSLMADKETLFFLRELIAMVKNHARVEINLLFPTPGSKIYNQLLRRGATSKELYQYNEENDIQYQKFLKYIEEHYSLTIGYKFGDISDDIINKFVSFINERREALNNILYQKYL